MIDIRRGDGDWVSLCDYLTVTDHLQLLSVHGETGELELSNGKCLGTLFLEHGEVIEALCARQQITGTDASLCLMCMRDAKCRYRRRDHARAKVIDEPTPTLLMDAACWTDEGRRLCGADRIEEETRRTEWILLVDFGPEGLIVPLDRPRMRVGRGSECDVVILMRSVSRQHAEIEISGDQVVLRDLDSTNGTLVNGQPIQEATITQDDEVQFGDIRAKFISKADAKQYRKTKPMRATSVIGYADTMHIGGDYPTIRKVTRAAA